MAERTVNVTINYKVNTAEVQKAQAASAAAQKATDELRKSTEAYGKAVTSANKQASDSTRSLTKDFNDLYSSVKLVLTAGIARQMVDISLNMAKLSGQVEGVNRAFQRLPNATLLLNDLRKATHGTVTDLELMQKALMAQNYKIPLQQLGTLLEFAATRAQQTGQEVNHLVDYIVTGIGLKSIKRLDDLGFTANRVKTALGGVSLQAASMGEVMTAVASLMNEDLKKTGGFAETSKTQVEQLERKWHELNVTVSEFGTQPGLLRFYDFMLENVTTGINKLIGGTELVRQKQAKAIAVQDVANTKERLLTAEILKDRQKTFDVIQQEANTRQQMIGRNNDEIKRLKEIRDEFVKRDGKNIGMGRAEAEGILEQIRFYEFKNLQLKESIRILNEYNTSLTIEKDEEKEVLGIIEKKRQEIERLEELREKSTSKGEISGLTKRIEKEQAELDAILGKTKQKTKDAGEEVRNYLADLSANEIFNVKTILEERVKARKEATEEEIRLEKEAAKKKEEIARQEAQKREDLQRAMASLTEELIRSTVDLALKSREDELDSISRFYDDQISLAGDNDRAKKELEIKRERDLERARQRQKEAEKRAATTRILIDGLVAIAKIFGEFGWPAGIYPAAIMAGITAVNVATVRKYKQGGINIPGPGTETSDSIPAMLSKGESVITAKATRRSMGLLEAIQANKIDDRILKGIDFSGGRQSFNDSRLVAELQSVKSELKRLKAPDLVQQAGVLYKVHSDNNGNKKRVRAQSMGY